MSVRVSLLVVQFVAYKRFYSGLRSILVRLKQLLLFHMKFSDVKKAYLIGKAV